MSSRQRKALFYLGGSTIRVSATSRWTIRSSPDFCRGLVGVGGLYVCAVTLGGVLWPLLPIPPHFFALAQRNGVEPQRNALMGAATGAVGSRPPLPRTRSPNITADCVKLTLPGQLTNQPQINLTHQSVPLGLTPNGRGGRAHQGDVEASKALFFGGSTPLLWASTKEMGSNRRAGHRPPPNVSAHTYKPKEKKGEPPARVPPWTPPPLKRWTKLLNALARSGQAVR